MEPHCISPDNKTLSCWLIPTAQGPMRSRSSSLSPPNIYIDMLACRSNAGPPCTNINRLLQPRLFILCPCFFLSISRLLLYNGKLFNPVPDQKSPTLAFTTDPLASQMCLMLLRFGAFSFSLDYFTVIHDKCP